MNGLSRNKLLFYSTTLIGVGLIIFFYLFVTKPITLEFKQLKREVEDKSLKLDKMEQVITDSKDKLAKIKQVEERLYLLDDTIPQKMNFKGFLIEIEELIRKYGIRLKKFSPGKIIKKEGYNQLPIRLSVIGDYQVISNFINDLNKLGRLVNIVTLAIKDTGDEDLKVDILLRIYSLQEVKKNED